MITTTLSPAAQPLFQAWLCLSDGWLLLCFPVSQTQILILLNIYVCKSIEILFLKSQALILPTVLPNLPNSPLLRLQQQGEEDKATWQKRRKPLVLDTGAPADFGKVHVIRCRIRFTDLPCSPCEHQFFTVPLTDRFGECRLQR